MNLQRQTRKCSVKRVVIFAGSLARPRKLMCLIALAVLSFVAAFETKATAQAANGKIAFTSNRDGARGIYVMDPDGANQIRLTDPSSWADYPEWSPDGRKIAFVGYSSQSPSLSAIFVMNADGSNRVEIARYGYQNFGIDPTLSWSPDGQSIAFDEADAWFSYIFIVNADGSGRRLLTSEGAYSQEPSWSPDGSRILFSAFLDNPNFARLYTIKPDGTDLQALSGGVEGFHDASPRWSPAGDKIVFRSEMWPTVSNIFIANADGTNRQCFDGCDGSGRLRYDAGFSPDGRKIVFSISENGGPPYISNIYTRNLDGSGFTQLTNTSGMNYKPSWQTVLHFELAGRVTTPAGLAVRRARVTLDDGTGNLRYAQTNPFGYFRFRDIPPGTHAVTARSKGRGAVSITITVTSSVMDLALVL